MSTLIVPCAGGSSRFGKHAWPKWMLTSHKGHPMAIAAVLKGALYSQFDRVIFGILSEHDEKYDAATGLLTAAREAGIKNAEVIVLPFSAGSSPGDVFQILSFAEVKGRFFVKDCDSSFALRVPECDCVAVADLHENDVAAANKSYVVSNEQGIVLAVKEKSVVSEHFSVGGYGFSSSDGFSETFLKMQGSRVGGELYVSHVINAMIADGHVFQEVLVTDYLDWGTENDWQRYKDRFKTYIFDIDGILVKNAGTYFLPRIGTQPAIERNVKLLKELHAAGNTIILMTSRPQAARGLTLSELRTHGIPYHELVMGCVHGSRVLINDFAVSNPYPSAVAVSLPRNSEFLDEMIR